MSDRLRALLVSYNFPPVGGAGVQRMVKLTKHLPAAGVRPAVLTVSNPSVPVLDESLLGDLPPEAELVRVRTFEPGYASKRAAWSATAESAPPLRRRLVKHAAVVARQLLVPDSQILWQPAAQLALGRRLAARADDVVLVSGPPFSQFLLAPLVRRLGRVGLVLDYRDEWSTYRTTYEMGSATTARLGDWLEPRLLRCAHAVTTATEEFRDSLLARFPFLDAKRVHAIPNGYDVDDFPAVLPEPPRDRFVVTYAGTIFRLTGAAGLLAAVRRLHARRPDLAKHLELRFIGRVVETELPSFAGMDALGVRRIGYLPHADVLPALAASHLCLCLLDDVPGAERIYPAKIFELMHLGRPILTLAPAGALARLVERHRLGARLHPRDEEAIAAQLERALEDFVARRFVPRLAAVDVDRYDRRALAREFAAVLGEAAARGRGAPVAFDPLCDQRAVG